MSFGKDWMIFKKQHSKTAKKDTEVYIQKTACCSKRALKNPHFWPYKTRLQDYKFTFFKLETQN